MTEEWKEIWKEVEGYEGKYKISNLGRIWNTITDKEVAQVITGIPQYKYVNMNINKQCKLIRVHRIVAEYFVDGRSGEYNVVDHIDRDKFNNHYTNLRWVNHSGNGRNRDNNIYIFGEAVKDYSQRYENPEAAYTYLAICLNQEMTDQEAVDKYQENLDYGLRRIVVQWEGVEVYLADLCERYNKDYFEVNGRLRKGWDIWNAIYNIYPEQPYSLEVPCEVVTGHWFPSKKYLGEYFGSLGGKVTDMAVQGCTYQQLKSYDKLDHFRKTVLGVTGTMEEICKHFGKTVCSVETRVRRGYTLEDALLEKHQRVKKVTINGKANSPKKWFESFDLDYGKVKKYRDKTKKSFEETLVHFGVDISDLEIIYSN